MFSIRRRDEKRGKERERGGNARAIKLQELLGESLNNTRLRVHEDLLFVRVYGSSDCLLAPTRAWPAPLIIDGGKIVRARRVQLIQSVQVLSYGI